MNLNNILSPSLIQILHLNIEAVDVLSALVVPLDPHHLHIDNMYFLRQGIQLSTHLGAVHLLVGHHGVDLAAGVEGHVLHQGVVSRLNIDHFSPGLTEAYTRKEVFSAITVSSDYI